MKTKGKVSKWPLIVTSLIIIGTTKAHAGSLDKFKKTIASEFSNLQGLYIAGGLVVASLLVYIIYNHVIKEKEDPNLTKHAAKPGANYRRHKLHHHPKQPIKKA